MSDPTSSQPTAQERQIRENILKVFTKDSRKSYKKEEFLDAISFGKKALQQCHELGNKKDALDLHEILYFSYLCHCYVIHAQGRSEEALENAKLALKHSKELEDEKSKRMSKSKSLALVFLDLQDFGEALINGEEWLSHFEENDDTDEKHVAQQTMTSAYHKRARNSLMNEQFKEASDDGEQALVYNRDDSIAIEIRWLLVRAYFSQEDFKNALEQFDRGPDMLSPKLDVEDYIKAGKIHRKMRRYDKAILYFEEAKKVANRNLKKKLNKWILEVNQSIEEANESIQDDIPQMIEDIGEIDNEKHGNKKEIEEEQTFCHTEENIEKEASGDEGVPHMEDITKEQCEVLDAEKTPFFEKKNGNFEYWIDKSSQISNECRVYKGSLRWMVPINQGELEEKKMSCSVLEVDDENTARHHQYTSYILGEVAVKIHTVDGCFLVFQEITSYFLDWYKAIYKSYKGDRERKNNWWKHIEYDVRRLFRGVIKSCSKLYPDYPHGNLMRGIAVLDGEAKLFNMKHPGIEGYKKDIACLLYMISNIVDGVHPDNFFEGLDDDCKKKTEELHCSKEFSTFLKFLEDRKNERVNIYTTFFWTQDQQIFFLESVYDLFWKEFKCLKYYWPDIEKLEVCFMSLGWNWEQNIPLKGPFRSVFDYNMDHSGEWEKEQIPLAYSIAFWRHSKTHYNDYSKKRKTVQEINIELNERFYILDHVFQAVCIFTRDTNDDEGYNRAIFERLGTLRDMPAM